MIFNCAVTVFIISAIGFCQATSGQDDIIVNLPGLPSQPTFKQYSGYLQAKGTRKLHYWFLESSSNPSVDPVVLWMNGGPGCSSMDGLLAEHGPFRINDDGETLKYNPWTWNQVANMIYLEAPAGVGFSYATDKNYTINDSETAANNLAALKDFFSKFPQFKKNDFYITGESYGGIYVPTLASDVLDDGSINLKGFAVGNGLSDNSMNDNSLILFAYYHGLIGDSLWSSLNMSCCSGAISKNCEFDTVAKTKEECASLVEEVLGLVWGAGLDPYNLYADCAVDNSLHYQSDTGKYVSRGIMKPFAFLPNSIKEKAFLKTLSKESVSVGPPCVNATRMTTYLNNPHVRAALHIPSEVQAWELCSAIPYVKEYDTMTPFYKKALSQKLRVLVYNGDVDMACNFLGDEWFVDSLHLKDPQARKMWYYKANGSKFIAGFSKAFDHLTLVTIKGAGHMVPSDKPIPALEMFINFIQDRPF